MNQEDTKILKAEGIHQGFQINNRYLQVISDVSLYVNKGEMVAITGASGSGKSTLLHILAGLDIPKKGEVWFHYKNIVKMSESKLANLRNNYMGFVFQQHHLIKELTALENVMLPGMISGSKLRGVPIAYDELRHRAEILLNQMGLKSRIDHVIGELSGGESQRVAVARALIQNPEIIFADEPTGNLDEANSLETFSILQEISKENQTSIVIVTHSTMLTQKCDQIYTIHEKTLYEN